MDFLGISEIANSQAFTEMQEAQSVKNNFDASTVSSAERVDIPKHFLEGLKELKKHLDTVVKDPSSVDDRAYATEIGNLLISLERDYNKFVIENPHNKELNFIFDVLHAFEYTEINPGPIRACKTSAMSSMMKCYLPTQAPTLQALLTPSLEKVQSRISQGEITTSFRRDNLPIPLRNSSVEQELFNLRRILETAEDFPGAAKSESVQDFIDVTLHRLTSKAEMHPDVANVMEALKETGLTDDRKRLPEVFADVHAKGVIDTQIHPILDRY